MVLDEGSNHLAFSSTACGVWRLCVGLVVEQVSPLSWSRLRPTLNQRYSKPKVVGSDSAAAAIQSSQRELAYMLMAVQKKDGNQEVQGSPRFVQSLTHFFRQEGLAERVICFYLL